MQLKDLLETGLIKDEDEISVKINSRTGKKINGNWYEDGVLRCADFYIKKIYYDASYPGAKQWEIILETEPIVQHGIAALGNSL